MRTSFLRLAAALPPAAAALPALAHDGHVQQGLAAGLAHPFGGVDHLLATVGIGLVAGWAASSRQAPAHRAPTARAGLAALLGLAAGATWSAWAPGVPGGAFEHAAALSLLAIAVALLAADRIGAAGVALLAIAVAVPHGWLHASEGTGAAYLTGLVATSAALFAAGGLAGRAAAAWRVAGGRWLAAGAWAGGFVWLLAAGAR